MPQPTMRSLHVDRPLTDISVAYMNAQEDYIAGKVFPIVKVPKQGDKYFQYSKAHWFRDEAKKRAPGTSTSGGGFDMDEPPTFFCDEWGYHMDVPDEHAENQDLPIDILADATRFVTDKMLMRREKLFVTRYFTTGIWGTDYSGVASAAGAQQAVQWDLSGSAPIQDIIEMKQKVARTTGKTPNTLVISALAMEALKQHSDVIDRYKYTQAGVMTPDLIAKVLGLSRVLVAGAVMTSSIEGAASSSYDYIFGRSMLLAYVQDPPTVLQPSAGYTFSWNKWGSDIGVFQYYIRENRATRVEASMYLDMKLIAADLGIFCNNIISAGFAS